MVSRSSIRIASLVSACAITVTTMVGCGANPNSLPSTVVVELPDGTTVEASTGSGVASLSNSKWMFFQTAAAAQGVSFVTIAFGENGNLEAFENNTIGSEIFGDSLIFDGTRRATSQPGFEYAATTFGAGTADGTGFSFEAPITAFFSGLLVGEATAIASGTFDPDDPDMMTGTFSFTSRLTVPIDIPGADQDIEISFSATRIVN